MPCIELRRVLQLFHARVTDLFVDPVGATDELDRMHWIGAEILMYGVVQNINHVAGLPLPAARLLGDARVISVRYVDIHVPVKIVAAAFKHVENFIGDLPLLARTTARRDLVQLDVDRLERRGTDASASRRMRPWGVVCHGVSLGLMTFLRRTSSGSRITDHSTGGPQRSSPADGEVPNGPC